nr:RNA helicase [Geodermatophilaceae bacterium]
VVSVVLYESRGNEAGSPRIPDGPVREALAATVTRWVELEGAESARGVAMTREPDLGFCWPVYRWARGEPLDRVLSALLEIGQPLAAGDFVRWCRQVLDLLDQLAKSGTPVAAAARKAVQAIRRGVVAHPGPG